MDEFGGRDTAEMVIEKDCNRLSKGEIGLSISDGKTIMACLQQFVVTQQCEAYVLTSRYCSDCEAFQPIKDSGKRRIRTTACKVVGLVTLTGALGNFRCLVGNQDRSAGTNRRGFC
jgi:hypothetical protein